LAHLDPGLREAVFESGTGNVKMLDKDAEILLVEDDRVDIMTVQRALKKNAVSNPLHIARTGLEALGMLRGEGTTRNWSRRRS